jgi:uncharacterized damage-inducible protein DinB
MSAYCHTLRTHLDYSAWSTARLLAAAAQLTPEELNKDFATADRSVLGTLQHIFSADRVWLGRIEGAPPDVFKVEHGLPELKTEWAALNDRWKAWAGNLDDAAVAKELEYHDLKGRPWKQPLHEIVLHVVNHATHHRGQVSGFLRALGHTPPPLDLIHYYRQQMGAASA